MLLMVWTPPGVEEEEDTVADGAAEAKNGFDDVDALVNAVAEEEVLEVVAALTAAVVGELVDVVAGVWLVVVGGV